MRDIQQPIDVTDSCVRGELEGAFQCFEQTSESLAQSKVPPDCRSDDLSQKTNELEESLVMVENFKQEVIRLSSIAEDLRYLASIEERITRACCNTDCDQSVESRTSEIASDHQDSLSLTSSDGWTDEVEREWDDELLDSLQSAGKVFDAQPDQCCPVEYLYFYPTHDLNFVPCLYSAPWKAPRSNLMWLSGCDDCSSAAARDRYLPSALPNGSATHPTVRPSGQGDTESYDTNSFQSNLQYFYPRYDLSFASLPLHKISRLVSCAPLLQRIGENELLSEHCATGVKQRNLTDRLGIDDIANAGELNEISEILPEDSPTKQLPENARRPPMTCHGDFSNLEIESGEATHETAISSRCLPGSMANQSVSCKESHSLDVSLVNSSNTQDKNVTENCDGNKVDKLLQTDSILNLPSSSKLHPHERLNSIRRARSDHSFFSRTDVGATQSSDFENSFFFGTLPKTSKLKEQTCLLHRVSNDLQTSDGKRQQYLNMSDSVSLGDIESIPINTSQQNLAKVIDRQLITVAEKSPNREMAEWTLLDIETNLSENPKPFEKGINTFIAADSISLSCDRKSVMSIGMPTQAENSICTGSLKTQSLLKFSPPFLNFVSEMLESSPRSASNHFSVHPPSKSASSFLTSHNISAIHRNSPESRLRSTQRTYVMSESCNVKQRPVAEYMERAQRHLSRCLRLLCKRISARDYQSISDYCYEGFLDKSCRTRSFKDFEIKPFSDHGIQVNLPSTNLIPNLQDNGIESTLCRNSAICDQTCSLSTLSLRSSGNKITNNRKKNICQLASMYPKANSLKNHRPKLGVANPDAQNREMRARAVSGRARTSSGKTGQRGVCREDTPGFSYGGTDRRHIARLRVGGTQTVANQSGRNSGAVKQTGTRGWNKIPKTYLMIWRHRIQTYEAFMSRIKRKRRRAIQM